MEGISYDSNLQCVFKMYACGIADERGESECGTEDTVPPSARVGPMGFPFRFTTFIGTDGWRCEIRRRRIQKGVLSLFCSHVPIAVSYGTDGWSGCTFSVSFHSLSSLFVFFLFASLGWGRDREVGQRRLF